MPRFDKGVGWYTHGTAEVDVYFPEDEVVCQYCPYLRADANGARYKCVLIDKVVYGLNFRRDDCPVKIKEEQE